MAQTPRGGLYEPPCKGHLEVCAIYSESAHLDTSDISSKLLKTPKEPPAALADAGYL